MPSEHFVMPSEHYVMPSEHFVFFSKSNDQSHSSVPSVPAGKARLVLIKFNVKLCLDSVTILLQFREDPNNRRKAKQKGKLAI